MLNGIRQCCKKISHRYSSEHRAVFCKSWILPIRIITLASLFAHLIYRYFYPADVLGVVIIFIHITVALSLLNECRRSQRYHELVEEFERIERHSKQ